MKSHEKKNSANLNKLTNKQNNNKPIQSPITISSKAPKLSSKEIPNHSKSNIDVTNKSINDKPKEIKRTNTRESINKESNLDNIRPRTPQSKKNHNINISESEYKSNDYFNPYGNIKSKKVEIKKDNNKKQKIHLDTKTCCIIIQRCFRKYMKVI
jgi:hypothetical protein